MKGIFIATLATCWATATLAQEEELLECGESRYFASQYTCFDDKFLCPVLNGEPTLRCGEACYSPFIYSCDGNQLNQLPIADYPFTVEVRSSEVPFAGLPFQACTGQFFLGPDKPCTTCPFPMCSGGDKTIFADGSALSVTIGDGRQSFFIRPDGALGYVATRRGPFEPPIGSIFGVTAYDGGVFTYAGANWRACPFPPLRDGEARWKIFADLPGFSFDTNCVAFEAITVESTTGEAGAYLYI